MRLNSVLKACSLACASLACETKEESHRLDTTAELQGVPPPDPFRESGAASEKSSDIGAGLPRLVEKSGKAVTREVKSGRKQGSGVRDSDLCTGEASGEEMFSNCRGVLQRLAGRDVRGE